MLTLLAHVTGAGGGGPWWTLWNIDPIILPNLVLMAAFYLLGWRERRKVAPAPAAVRPRQAWAFGAALVAVAAALLSPIDPLASELLSVHMVQHMILMNVAAPLFVLGAPGRVCWWALTASQRRGVARVRRWGGRHGMRGYWLWQPVVLWVSYAAVLWVWHLPRLYEAALVYPWVHDAQHLLFFGVACLFWRVLFDPVGRLRMRKPAAVLYLFTTSLQATLLGVFMGLAPRVWYGFYEGRTGRFGLAALEDQQMAGFIMWMPACMAYALVAAIILAVWLAEPERPATARA